MNDCAFQDNVTGNGGESAGSPGNGTGGRGGDGAGLYATGTTADVDGCTFSGNVTGAVSYTYCCVQGGVVTSDNHNIDKDPLLDADWLPQTGSDCIDSGNNEAVPADAADVDGDDDSAEDIPLDRLGNPRISDGYVDMGAHEVRQ